MSHVHLLNYSVLKEHPNERRYLVECKLCRHQYTMSYQEVHSMQFGDCPGCKEKVAATQKPVDSQARWDQDFLALAKFWAERRSKDPSTKTGAVIVAPDHSITSLGYNGFAKGVNDSPERYADRDIKYKLVVHCERNAIIYARCDLTGHTLYTWPFCSCSVCANMVIQAGIVRCVAPPLPEHLKERWGEDIKLAQAQFEEAGVKMDFVELAQ